MSESNRKGSELEQAVEAIERNLLEKYKEQCCSISRNEIIKVDGVRHEVDVLVRVATGSEQESLHAFECKNLKKPVGKNVISIFSDVLTQIGAGRGTIIARSFSKDAVALAKKHPLIELVKFEDLGTRCGLECSHVSHQFTAFRAHLTFGCGLYVYQLSDYRYCECVFRGNPDNFAELCHEFANKWLHSIGTFRGRDGEVNGSVRLVFKFDEGELTIWRRSVVKLVLDVRYEGAVGPARLSTAISVAQRGSFMKFDFDKKRFGGHEVTVNVLGAPR